MKDQTNYKRWLWRKDIDDLIQMFPTESMQHRDYIMKEIAQFTELVEGQEGNNLKKFQNGMLSMETLIWDKFYKRVIIQAIISEQFELPLHRMEEQYIA